MLWKLSYKNLKDIQDKKSVEYFFITAAKTNEKLVNENYATPTQHCIYLRCPIFSDSQIFFELT